MPRPGKDSVVYYLAMPDGTVCWGPKEEDYEQWREEMLDLQVEQEWD